ncbi:uncharacterized protein B0P05DRAFT_522247 [Gilbertella persicaria]|uniref:uncharacterized protein n=1 Tax=Gilbertella persicaria TaxID=101096 RepID=UPI00221E6FE4|nr:uncharacterized protein B0P05DRAFT_522247 [Gilbertella persicaria]KAI8097833.1 hypothetical protein B0P05DRAFT_522247 [Gilbertella persicaria]
MYDKDSLAIVSSVLFPQTPIEGSSMKRRKLPGAWIDEDEEEEPFERTVSPTAPKLTTQILSNEEDIHLLKQTIASLKKEKEKLEETNDIVKKSIQIVARKRLKAHNNKKIKHTTADNDQEEEEEEEYIVVPNDLMPTQDELKAAGIDGWEWITAY